MTQQREVTLSENHRRGIAATLTLLDEMLCRFERWLRGERDEGPMYRQRNSMTAEQKRAIQREIDRLRQRLTALRDALGLEANTQDIASAIWSQSSACMEPLLELQARYLRRYGDVPDGFAEYFDPQVEWMLDRIMRIADAAQPRRSASDGP